MMQVYLNKDGIDIHTTFKGYLLTALRNRLFNHKRNERSKLCDSYKEILQDTPNDEINSYIDQKEILLQVQGAIARLPEQCRNVFVLSREHGLHNYEIANKLGISVKTVEAHMTKALKHLRREVNYNWVIAVLVFSEAVG